MQGKDELPLTLSTTPSATPTPPAPPNTPINHTAPQPQTTTGPQLIRPDQMQLYMANVFFTVPTNLRSNVDELDSDSDSDPDFRL